MKITLLLFFTLGLSLKLMAANFGPLPSKQFGPSGALACVSKENCQIPSKRSLQKIAEDFLSFSDYRVSAIDKIEQEIRSNIETYEQAGEEAFSRDGNNANKSFYEKGVELNQELLERIGVAAARNIVGRKSPFLTELKNLNLLLKDFDVRLINSKGPEESIEIKEQKNKAYFDFRTSSKFKSYKNIEQVKELIQHYEKSGSTAPWLENNKMPLRLSFSSCPVSVRRALKRKSPSIKYDFKKGDLQFDLKNSPNLLNLLVQNGLLLKIKCTKKQTGGLKSHQISNENTLEVQYQLTQKGLPIFPNLK